MRVESHSKQIDELLKPVRREFDQSEMSEEDLVRFLTGLRDAVRREKVERTR